MKVIVIGANGQLGSEMVEQFSLAGHHVVSVNHRDLEISDKRSVSYTLGSLDFDTVVNTAGVHNRPCEENPIEAFKVNSLGAKNVAEEALRHDALMIHISTDLVYDGKADHPYAETDREVPVTIYGNTKLNGDHFVINSGAKHQVLRTSVLFGKNPTRGKAGGLNFVQLMLKLAKEDKDVKVVNDKFTSPTSAISLAKQAVALSTTEHYGIFHSVGTGGCSWYDLAAEVFAQTGTKAKLSVDDPNADPVVRPKNLILDTAKLTSLGLNVFLPWKDELRQYLRSTNELL